jgi:hypothetical protein
VVQGAQRFFERAEVRGALVVLRAAASAAGPLVPSVVGAAGHRVAPD